MAESVRQKNLNKITICHEVWDKTKTYQNKFVPTERLGQIILQEINVSLRMFGANLNFTQVSYYTLGT